MADIGVSLEYAVLCGFGQNHEQEKMLDYFGSCERMLSRLSELGVKFIELCNVSHGDNKLPIKVAYYSVKNAGLSMNFHINQTDKVYAHEFCDYFEDITTKANFTLKSISTRPSLSENRMVTANVLRSYSDEANRRGLEYTFCLENGFDMQKGYLCQECEQIEKTLILTSRKSVGACFNFANRVINSKYADNQLELVPSKRFCSFVNQIYVSNVMENGRTCGPLYNICPEIQELLKMFCDFGYDKKYCIRLNEQSFAGQYNPGKALEDSVIALRQFTNEK